MIDEALWWEANELQVGDAVLTTVRRLETNQADVFERFHRLERLYDPNSPLADSSGDAHRGGVQENVIASNVDANVAAISTADVRARQMTDGADWQQQRRARQLELYAEEQNKTFHVMPKCRVAYREAAKKGNGLVKVTKRFKKPVVKQVMVENFVVDQNETRDGQTPTHVHEWVSADANELIAEYPAKKAQIVAARKNRHSWRIDSRVFPEVGNEVVYLDSYRLPIGEKGEKGYVAGRHVKTLAGGVVLDDKPWEKPFFPYGVQTFIPRAKSWYGISGAERVAGIQRALNKRNWQIEKQNDNIALPTTWVRPADAGVTTKTSRIGNIGVIKGDYPHTVMPQAVSPETYKSRLDLLDAGNREFGQSQMATHGTKPGGLDSGVALREFKDQTSDRYSPQEKGFEDLVLDVTWLLLDVCKDLGKDAPLAVRKGRFGKRTIRWSDVDMGDVRIQLYAASNLPRTPAGRMQFVIELAQAGVISTDSSRRLLQHPDLESELSLYSAALESIEQCFDEIAEGRPVTPDPFMNAAMAVWRGQMEYLKWLGAGAPEKYLELLRQFVVTSAWIKKRAEQPSNTNAAAPGAMPQPGVDPSMDPAAAGPGAGMPPLAQGPPQGPAPQAAFAPQAMQLVAGAR